MSSVRVLVGTRKGAFIADLGRRATVGDERATLRAGRSTTSQAHRLIRTGSTRRSRADGSASRSNVPTTAARPGSRSATSSATTASPARTSGTTARRTPGSSRGCGTLSLPHRPRHRLRRRRRRSACSVRPTAATAGRSWPAYAATAPAPPGSPAQAACACTRSSSTRSTRTDVHRHLGRRRLPEPTTAAKTWQPINGGLQSGHPRPRRRGRSLRPPHRDARVPPDVLYMQKHWDVMRSDDAGDSWQEVSGNLPSDFGFPIGVHAHEPDTVYVVPITSDSEHYPPDGKLRVYRSRTGGDEWEPLNDGLAARTATSTCCATRWRWTRWTPAASTSARPAARCTPRRTAATAWAPIVRDLPAVLSVEVQTLP